MMIKTNHSGQVALIMVLIMTVVSAVAVSVAGRSTVESRIQEMNIESTEALLTAQAGLEEAISKDTPVTGSLGEGNNYSVTLGSEGETGVNSEKINPGEQVEVDLVGYVGISAIKVYWKPAETGGAPSIFVSDVRTNQIKDRAFDTTGTNGFTKINSGGSLGGVSYNYVTPQIPIGAASIKFRITVLEDAAFVGIEPVGGSFPPQSTQYRAVADLTSTETSRKYGLEYVESKNNQIPGIFDYVLFSGGSLVQ